MNLELSPTERAIGWVLSGIFVGVLAILGGISILRAHRAQVAEASALRAQLATTTSEREANTQEMAPFVALAEQQFPNEPTEQRLPLLFRRIEGITSAMSSVRGRRQLDAAAIARIRAKLDQVPGIDIEVGAVWQDPEALALAEELRNVFQGAGFKPRQLAQYIPPPNFPSGVAIYSRHELDDVLGEAIARIFTELGQAPVQWLDEDLVSSAGQNEPPPELKIIVSHR